MPELPEVEITARRLDAALRGARIESALAPGINALKTFDPPLSVLAGRQIVAVGRRGKQLIVRIASAAPPVSEGLGQAPEGRARASEGQAWAPAGQARASEAQARASEGQARGSEGAPAGRASASEGQSQASEELALVLHLMSAGRLQLFDKHAGPRDRSSRVLVRIDDGRELRLREFGSKQAAWAKLLPVAALAEEPALASLGPEAWPDPPENPALAALLDVPRPLHALLRDQHVIAGIGRSWVDEILWETRLSPYKRGSDLDADELARLRAAIVRVLGTALEHYEHAVALPIPDKLPMPLRVHRHEGEPCPRCGGTLQAVHFEDYVIAYCPACQTDGRVLKDRRLSRLLK
jgi:formamidopyrimidine-DNA glycosylase